jgi:serine/threonine-protein kinase
VFGTSPLADSLADEDRFVQKRVRLFVKVMLSFSGVFTLGTVVKWVWMRAGWSGLSVQPSWMEGLVLGMVLTAACTSLLAAEWWYLSRHGRSRQALHLVESLGTLAYCAMLSALPRALPKEAPESGPVLLLVLVLVVRAAIVPSRASVTMLVGLLGTAALVVATYFDNLGVDPAVEPLVAYLWMVPLFWGLAFSIVTSLISRVIYGLHQSVRDALKLGNYTLDAKLGEGGMGEVYLGHHALLKRPTAIKLLPPEKVGETAVARFEREVQQTALLNHPNVVAIYDYGRTPDDIFYYAMEYLDGLTLEQLIEMDGPQPAGRVIYLLSQVAHALAEAHGRGLIHRDIKPANIVVCNRGGAADMAKVVDFGLVKDLQSPEPSLSAAEVITGTPLYMAPETISSPDEVDARVDLYALGAVGYFLLTGTTVFEGKTTVEVCSHHLLSAPIPPSIRGASEVAADLESVILRCLEKEPADRYQDAAALRGALQSCSAASDWGLEQALAWWAEHGRAVRRLRTESRRPIAGGSRARLAVTVAVRKVADGGSQVGTPSQP